MLMEECHPNDLPLCNVGPSSGGSGGVAGTVGSGRKSPGTSRRGSLTSAGAGTKVEKRGSSSASASSAGVAGMRKSVKAGNGDGTISRKKGVRKRC